MRRSLGTAVFSGMLGVTLFGIFLTPVFFYVIRELGATRLFQPSPPPAGWVPSVLGGVLGLAGGYLLAQLGIVSLPWALVGGAGVGSWRCWRWSAFTGKSAPTDDSYKESMP